MATAYPKMFPVDEVQTLLPVLRGQVPEVGTAVHAAWVIVGYGLGQQLPVRIDALTVRPSLNLLTDGAVATILENACPQAAEAGKPLRVLNTSNIPWDILIPTLLSLLRRWTEAR